MLIIGSGFAGTYAAYELSKQYGERLCLVEKEDRDGGRIVDLSETPSGPRFGAGPLRVTHTQPEMHVLAKRLGIIFEQAQIEADSYRVRGRHYIANYTS